MPLLPRKTSKLVNDISRASCLLAILALTGCKPPAADEYIDRMAANGPHDGPTVPIDSPNVDGAGWAETEVAGRILYGKAGQPALLALSCEKAQGNKTQGSGMVHLTRFVIADPKATAFMALIGNGHITRLPVDAQWNGQAWLWEGRYAAINPDLDVLTGPREVELTIPGAGSVVINPSQRPAQLIDRCRGLVPQEEPEL